MEKHRGKNLKAESLICILSGDEITEEREGEFTLLLGGAHQVRHEIFFFVD